MCDKLHLLSKGRTIFHGAAAKGIEYFSRLPIIDFDTNLYLANPADFLSDVAACDVKNKTVCISSDAILP
jgi:hypothetical protein